LTDPQAIDAGKQSSETVDALRLISQQGPPYKTADVLRLIFEQRPPSTGIR
jgi:hypothetical protein